MIDPKKIAFVVKPLPNTGETEMTAGIDLRATATFSDGVLTTEIQDLIGKRLCHHIWQGVYNDVWQAVIVARGELKKEARSIEASDRIELAFAPLIEMLRLRP